VKSNVKSKQQEVVVVGSGWAGLSSAVRLKQNGFSVEIFEATRQFGGRARCTKYKNQTLDNGQHILLGACQETLNLFQSLGMKEADYLYRQPLKLDLFLANKKSTNQHDISNTPINLKELHINPAHLPAPLHLLFAFINTKDITFIDKYHLIKLFTILKWHNFEITTIDDVALLQFLLRYQQSKSIIDRLWEPLCLAIMNTPIKTASAKVFFKILKHSFTGDKKHSDLLLFSTPLCKTLPQNAFQFLQQQNQTNTSTTNIHLNSRIDSIIIENSSIVAIKSNNCEYSCSNLILSTPVHITKKLLSPHHQCSDLVNDLQKIDYQPIYTIYLQYQEQFQLPNIMSGLLNSYSQWVFDKSFCQQSGLLAVIISGSGKHQKISKDELFL